MDTVSRYIACFLLCLVTQFCAKGQSPDQDYFQQEVNYSISVVLDDANHKLQCEMEIWYYNNSPDILEEIHFNIWPNAYSSQNTPMGKQLRDMGMMDFQFCEEDEMGWLKGLDFNVNGSQVTHQVVDEFGEHVLLPLPDPLLPMDSVRIVTPFEVKVPSGEFSRLGHVGDSYMITQWYPKPAVYDRNGWHPMPYLSQGEFYSEFGSFNVSIMLENSFYLGATGQMTEKEEVKLTERAKSTAIMTDFPDNSFPPRTRFINVVRYQQDNIHDFAWFADRRFNVLHDTIILPHSGRVVDAWVLFTNSHPETWKKSMEYVKDGTRFYSQHVGDYPYDHITVVDGTISAGGGMEYPMVTVVNSTGNDKALEKVIVHEIGHNWFYGILGSDERENAWMDEGINSFYEVRYFEEKYGMQDSFSGLLSEIVPDSRGLNELGYLLNAREHIDQELHLCAHRYTDINYGVMVYSKAAYLMQYLRSVMGTETFDASMKHYYEKWKYKHPSPSDMQVALQEHSGLNLDWFFKELIPTRKKIDFKVKSYNKKENTLLIKSKTSFSGPLKVGYYDGDQLIGTEVLQSDQELSPGFSGFDRILLDPQRDIPEMNRKNDTYRLQGILKRTAALKFKRLSRPGDSRDRFVFYNPSLLWNDHDKWMMGLNLTNFEGLAKDLEWTVSPLWSFQKKELVGMARVRKKIWLGEQSPNRITLGVEAKRFSYDELGYTGNGYRIPGVYTTIKPSLNLKIIPKSLKNGSFDLTYTAHYVAEEYTANETGQSMIRENVYHVVDYDYNYSRGLFSTMVNAEYEFHQAFNKAHLSLENRFVYNKLKKEIGIRLYGGIFKERSEFDQAYGLGLGGQSGRQSLNNGDYRYEYLFLGRSADSGFIGQQHVRNRGGFSLDSGFGTSESWVASVNINADLPVPLPLSVYINGGIYQSELNLGESVVNTFISESGLRLSLIKDYVDVSFPLVFDKETKRILRTSESGFGEWIRFQIRFEELDLRKQIFKTVFK